MSLQGAPYVCTMRPVRAHPVPKPLWGKIDGPTVRHICAHYAPHSCPLYVQSFRSKPVCQKCAPDVSTTRPLCAHCVWSERYGPALSSRFGQYLPTMCPPCAQFTSDGAAVSSRCAQEVPTMRSLCAHYLETLIRGQSYASTMCPVCAHYVSKPPPGKIDGATVHPVWAH